MAELDLLERRDARLPTSSLRASRILVVDDEPANTTLLAAVLAKAGFTEVAVEHDSAVALRCLPSFDPHVVLLDLHMPDPDGFTVLAAIRAHEATRFVPVVVLTADSTDGARDRALLGGATDFLTKPLDVTETVLRVSNALEVGLLHRHLREHNDELQAEVDRHGEADRAERARRDEARREVQAVLDAGGPEIAYQPIVDLDAGRAVGVEALSRFAAWGEPRPPDVWFALAESVGLGIELELAAVSRAVAGLDHLPEACFVSVNLSPAAIGAPELAGLVGEWALGARLVVELTEHAAVDDYTEMRAMLDRLRTTHGLRLAIDDTGSGFASLRHIHSLAPDTIKLDRYFVDGIDRDPARRALCASVVRLAADTGATLVAEGIETEAELATLRSLGVRRGQGYLLARPGPLPFDPALLGTP